MGMRIGTTSIIDEINSEDISKFGSEIGIDQVDLAKICRAFVEAAPKAMASAAESLPTFEALPYVAWDLQEDMANRLRVLEQVAC